MKYMDRDWKEVTLQPFSLWEGTGVERGCNFFRRLRENMKACAGFALMRTTFYPCAGREDQHAAVLHAHSVRLSSLPLLPHQVRHPHIVLPLLHQQWLLLWLYHPSRPLAPCLLACTKRHPLRALNASWQARFLNKRTNGRDLAALPNQQRPIRAIRLLLHARNGSQHHLESLNRSCNRRGGRSRRDQHLPHNWDNSSNIRHSGGCVVCL